MAFIEIDEDDILNSMTNYEKQEMANMLYDDGVIPDKLEESDDPWDIAVKKLIGNKFKLTKEEEDIILIITNKIN